MSMKRIAIVGSGISGISALFALQNSGHEVHLYEAQDRLGGHTNTVMWKHKERKAAVDVGFIVMNTATYPNFIAFLKELGVATVPTAMTFGVCRDEGSFEWSGTSLHSLFAQRSNITRPSFWRMIFDIVRFNQFALDLLSDVDGTLDNQDDQSIGEYLEREGYSAAFRDDYLIPMTACIWSTGADKCTLEFPAVTLVRFMWNHHLLSTVATRPDWLTIPGGSKKYVDAVMRNFPQTRIHLSSPVKTLRNGKDGKVILCYRNGEERVFDDVILACHGDEAMDIISASASEKEKEIMSSFHTTVNKAYLHSDLSFMPRRPATWSSWNYLSTSKPNPSTATNSTRHSASSTLQTVSLTYNMNILQHMPVASYSHILVTLNPPHPPDSSLIQTEFSYTHPLYNAAAIRAQSRLEEIQGVRGVWYCGAWTGYGFHEDGFESGLRVAAKLGGSVPWEMRAAKFIRGKRPMLGWKDHAVRLVISWIQWLFVFVEWSYALVMRHGKGNPVTQRNRLF